jgi:hypothetical protein
MFLAALILAATPLILAPEAALVGIGGGQAIAAWIRAGDEHEPLVVRWNQRVAVASATDAWPLIPLWLHPTSRDVAWSHG